MASDKRALVDRSAVVAATAERLEALHALLARFWARVDQVVAESPDAVWRLRFATAVAEIGANIVRHAYPLDTGTDRLRLRLRLRAFPNHIEARFTDRGAPFTQLERLGDGPAAALPVGPGGATGTADSARTAWPPGSAAVASIEAALDLDSLDAASSIAEGGYGLRLARAAVDVVTYARTATGRNVWRLAKRF